MNTSRPRSVRWLFGATGVFLIVVGCLVAAHTATPSAGPVALALLTVMGPLFAVGLWLDRVNSAWSAAAFLAGLIALIAVMDLRLIDPSEQASLLLGLLCSGLGVVAVVLAVSVNPHAERTGNNVRAVRPQSDPE